MAVVMMCWPRPWRRAGGGFEASPRLLRLAVEARRIAPVVAQGGGHPLQDALVGRRRGGVVEVDAVGHCGSILANVVFAGMSNPSTDWLSTDKEGIKRW